MHFESREERAGREGKRGLSLRRRIFWIILLAILFWMITLAVGIGLYRLFTGL